MKPGMFYLFPNQNYLDLRPYQSGYADNVKNASFGPAVRNHYLFHYVISGAGALTSNAPDGTELHFHIHSGQGFMIFPNQITTYYADQHHPWEYVWIEFDGMLAPEILRMCGLTIEEPVYTSNDKILTRLMLEAMMEMAKPDRDAEYYNAATGEFSPKSPLSSSEETQFYKMSKLYLFADCLARSSALAKSGHSDGSMADYYLQKSFTYIEHNFQDPITVESIAAQCNIHRNRLLKIFKDKIGKGPQAYLMEYRMSKAAQLLITTNLSINEIGNAVGYPNQLHFSRAFKNVYGASPRQYKEKAAEISGADSLLT